MSYVNQFFRYDFQNFYLSVNSTDAMQVYPSRDYSIQKVKKTISNISLGGINYTYKLDSIGFQITLPLDYVSSGDRMIINSWFLTDEPVHLTMDVTTANPSPLSGNTAFNIETKITNKNGVLTTRSGLDDSRYSGILFLTSVGTLGVSSGAAF